jgi:hypothetical protein
MRDGNPRSRKDRPRIPFLDIHIIICIIISNLMERG